MWLTPLLPGKSAAIGCDDTRSVLFQSYRGQPKFAIEGQWTEAGSRDVNRTFVGDGPCRLVIILQEVLSSLWTGNTKDEAIVRSSLN